MSQKEILLKHAGAWENLSTELNRLDALEPGLRAEAKRIIDEMGETASLDTLLAKPQGQQFDAATDQNARTLKVIETKLQLMPGVKKRLSDELNKVNAYIRDTSRQLFAQARQTARDKVEELMQTEYARALKACGGDDERAKTAARAFVENSEAKKWYDYFGYAILPDPVSDQPAYVIRYLEKFEKGAPVSDLPKS